MPVDPMEYRSIKELVLHQIKITQGKVDYETVTAEVRRCFPDSKWKKTHWAWYRHQIKKGRFKDILDEENQTRFKQSVKGRRPRDEKVKVIGDSILKHVRLELNQASSDDENLRFKLNRWIYARLQEDEKRQKRPIKKALWESGEKSCQLCGKDFEVIKGVEIHRINEEQAYSLTNCQLLCRPCHIKLR